MSLFSDLDASGRVDQLLQYLDDTDGFLAAYKAYVAAAAARYVPNGLVLDLGCGVGHDLVRLRLAGLRPVGLDPSASALARAQQLEPTVVRGSGEHLPFGAGVFDGCRVERVLQHVDDPGRVLDEVLRVVRPDGFLAVLEPDQASLAVESDVLDRAVLGRHVQVRHAAIGSVLPDLLRRRGCLVDDVVTELSFGHALERLPSNAELLLDRAVASGDVTPAGRDAWLAEQRDRTAAGTFEATWTKVLVIARAPGPGAGGRGAASSWVCP
jgi:SAM-dependent methyltransferase